MVTSLDPNSNIISLVKPVDEILNNDATVGLDPTLTYDMLPGQYTVLVNLWFRSTVNSGFRARMTGLASFVGDRSIDPIDPDLPNVTRIIQTAVNYAGNGLVQMTFWHCVVACTAVGSFGVSWSQVTSSPDDTTLFRGSTMLVFENG